MKHIIPILVILLLLSSGFVGVSYTVKKSSPVSIDGNTLYVGGSGPDNYTTIQSAIDNASGGDTVFVYDDSSPYYENLVVNKSINLIGEDRDTTVVNGSHLFDIIVINTGYVLVEGFTLTNCGWSDDDSCINIYSNNNKICNNEFIFSHYGITINSGCYNFISNNNFNNNCVGIRVRRYDCNYNNISSNNIIFNGYSGIEITGSRNEIYKNNISNNDVGIRLTIPSSYNIISNNIIRTNQESGIEFDFSNNNNIISKNIIENSETGIKIVGANNNIVNNHIMNNNNGIKISRYTDSWEKNYIIRNNFINNNKSAFFQDYSYDFPFFNSNKWRQNYWEKTKIFPKIIVGNLRRSYLGQWHDYKWLEFDWMPVTTPYDIEVL